MEATTNCSLQVISACPGDKDLLQFASISLVLRRRLSRLSSHANPVSLSLEGIGVSGLWNHFELWEVPMIVQELTNVEVLSKLLLPDARAVRTFIAAVHRARKPHEDIMTPGEWRLQHIFAVEFTFPKTSLAAYPAAEEEYGIFGVRSSQVVLPRWNADLHSLQASKQAAGRASSFRKRTAKRWLSKHKDVHLHLTQQLGDANVYYWTIWVSSHAMEDNPCGVGVVAASAWSGFRATTEFTTGGSCIGHVLLNVTDPGHEIELKRALEHGQPMPFVLSVWTRAPTQ